MRLKPSFQLLIKDQLVWSASALMMSFKGAYNFVTQKGQSFAV
jgi:hypothetical protein